jgi:hypothetical protein
MNEAAAHFRVSRRFFQDFLRGHPFYQEMGRRKLFFPDDLDRIRDALRRPSSSKAARRTTRPAERASDDTLAELRALLKSRQAGR